MYKTILLHVDSGAGAAVRLRLAAMLAERHGAHLVGCATPGTEADEHDPAGAELQRFAAEAQRRGVASLETRRIADHAAEALVMQSACADLVITGPDCGAAVAAGIAVGVPDYVALHGGCPVLMVPGACTAGGIGRRIVVGWNGTLEAAHAIHAALPLLQDAARVQIAVIAPQALTLRPGQQPGADLATWLGRHGVGLEVLVEDGARDAGRTLLHLAHRGNADLIVAGAYGHNRFRELVAGGATRTLLDNPDTCVFLAH